MKEEREKSEEESLLRLTDLGQIKRVESSLDPSIFSFFSRKLESFLGCVREGRRKERVGERGDN